METNGKKSVYIALALILLLTAAVNINALGNDLLIQFLGHGHDRTYDDRTAALATGGRLHEMAVDLDGIKWKALQIGQRRVSRAEIVERKTGACDLQHIQHFCGAFRILHHQRFQNQLSGESFEHR